MKKILLMAISFLIILPLVQSYAKGDQDDDVKIVLVKEDNSDNYYYEGVVKVDSISKEEMFRRAKQWVLSTFKTGDVNSQFDEPNLSIYNSPTIILKQYQFFSPDYLNFKLTILFKDGRYKFRFDNLIVKSNVYPKAPPKPYNGIKMWWPKKYSNWIINNANISLLSLANSLEESIKTGTSSASKDDNW